MRYMPVFAGLPPQKIDRDDVCGRHSVSSTTLYTGPYAEDAWTARYSGPSPTWRPSYSIFNIIIMGIERTPDAKDTRRQRASIPITHWQISVALSMAEALSRLIPNADGRLSLVIRHQPGKMRPCQKLQNADSTLATKSASTCAMARSRMPSFAP